MCKCDNVTASKWNDAKIYPRSLTHSLAVCVCVRECMCRERVSFTTFGKCNSQWKVLYDSQIVHWKMRK